MKVERVVDTKGQICPLPIINLFRVIRRLQRDDIVEIHSTCPAFHGDLKAWLRRTRNELLELRSEGTLSTAFIKKSA